MTVFFLAEKTTQVLVGNTLKNGEEKGYQLTLEVSNINIFPRYCIFRPAGEIPSCLTTKQCSASIKDVSPGHTTALILYVPQAEVFPPAYLELDID